MSCKASVSAENFRERVQHGETGTSEGIVLVALGAPDALEFDDG